MYINKITLGLFIVYVIINAYLVIGLASRVDYIEPKLDAVSEQSRAASLLVLAHVELHGLERDYRQTNRYNNYDNLLPVLPRKNYD